MADVDIREIFGARLKALRDARGLDQQEIGNLFNMGKSTVSQWESGRLPHPTIIARLATFFDVSADYLLGLSNERRPGAGIHPIDNPELVEFMKSVNGQFRLAPNLSDKSRQIIMEDLADYFKFQLEKHKAKETENN